jgi:hypothetical protein
MNLDYLCGYDGFDRGYLEGVVERAHVLIYDWAWYQRRLDYTYGYSRSRPPLISRLVSKMSAALHRWTS